MITWEKKFHVVRLIVNRITIELILSTLDKYYQHLLVRTLNRNRSVERCKSVKPDLQITCKAQKVICLQKPLFFFTTVAEDSNFSWSTVSGSGMLSQRTTTKTANARQLKINTSFSPSSETFARLATRVLSVVTNLMFKWPLFNATRDS